MNVIGAETVSWASLHQLNTFMYARITLPKPPMPFVVPCHGLAREEIGDELFEREIWARRHWLTANCQEPYDINPLREAGRLVGRQFLFACPTEAAAFKLWFPMRLQ